jgi:hypothetical protein
MAFTMAPLSNTPWMRTIFPPGPFRVTPCTKGTSGNGLVSNLLGSSDPTVYRSTICISVDGIYIFPPSVARVHTAESESMSPSGNSMLAGTVSLCSSISDIWAVKLSTALTTLARFPGSDVCSKVVQVHTDRNNCHGGTMTVWAHTEEQMHSSHNEQLQFRDRG